MRVERADIQSPEALQLIDALNAELTAAYSDTPGANHFRVDSSEVAPGQGAYVIAWRGETPIGCGAVRRLDAKTAEIKRMYVIPPERGAGVGRRIVLELESQARVLGVDRVVLETGTKQAVAIAQSGAPKLRIALEAAAHEDEDKLVEALGEVADKA